MCSPTITFQNSGSMTNTTQIIKQYVEMKLKCKLTKWCLNALIAHFSLRRN